MSDRQLSNLDLMRYADGEIEPEREAEVEALLRQSNEARATVEAFGVIGELVRAAADERAASAGADAIADQVMARIESEQREALQLLPASSTGLPSLGQRVSRARRIRRQFIYATCGVTGLALAAAVALLVGRFAGSDVRSLLQAPSGGLVSSGPELVVASAPSLVAEHEDIEPSVMVEAVEFGAHTGTIFYVPNGTGTTTVVWLTDEESGGGRE